MTEESRQDPQGDAARLAAAITKRERLLRQMAQGAGPWFLPPGRFIGFLACGALFLLVAVWLFRREDSNLFFPCLVVAIGVTVLLEAKVEAIGRRLDALIELLEDRGAFKK